MGMKHFSVFYLFFLSDFLYFVISNESFKFYLQFWLKFHFCELWFIFYDFYDFKMHPFEIHLDNCIVPISSHGLQDVNSEWMALKIKACDNEIVRKEKWWEKKRTKVRERVHGFLKMCIN